MKTFNWLIKLIPEQYRIGIAIKKVSYLVGKLAAGFVTAKLVTAGKLSPEDCAQIQLAITTGVAGGLEMLHDWARVKWPNVSLL